MDSYSSSSSAPWASLKSSINYVVIESGVTNVGSYAFYKFTSLTSITIPDGVTSIGDYAFYYCTSLASITIPNSVKSIGSSAFMYCESLSFLTIGNSVTFIGNSAFYNCTNLEKVYWNAIGVADFLSYSRIFYNAGTAGNGIELVFGDNVERIPAHLCYSDNYDYSPKITSVTIGNSVTSIGDYTFYYCTSLTSATIGNSVTSIGYRAFYYCTSLTSITIPDSVTSIDISAFYNCRSLTYVTIGNGLTSIGDHAFEYCTSLTSITIPDSVTSIGVQSFYSCTRLASVTIGNSVTSIGNSAFSHCGNLTSIAIPDSVTSIGDSVFYDCARLTSIAISDSVTSIGNAVFSDCPSLISIDVDENNSNYCSVSGILFDKNKSTLARYPAAKTSISYEIPDTVTSIDAYAFQGCINLMSITIPDGVTSIGDKAFYDCASLTSIAMSDSVTCIGKSAFHNTGYYNQASNWENEVLYIGNRLLSAKKTLSDEYTIKEGTRIIAGEAFEECTSLTAITIPDSVTSIGDEAFYNCTNLEKAYWNAIGIADFTSSSNLFYNAGTAGNGIELVFSDNVERIPAHLCDCLYSNRKPKIISVTIGNSVTCIGDNAFNECASLTAISIPDSVTNIGSRAFLNCKSLSFLTIGNSVKSIGDYAFYGCSIITSITIPDSVTNIGSSAFRYCESLSFLTIGNSVKSIGDYAFYGCTDLTIITIPDSVTSIGDYVLYGCTNLEKVYWNAIAVADFSSSSNPLGNSGTAGNGIELVFGDNVERIPAYLNSHSSSSKIISVTIGNSATSIGDYAFYYCTSLASITIGDSVTSIGDYAFFNCKSLISITIPDSVTSIGGSVFQSCTGLTSVTIGNNVNSMGSAVFSNCTNLEKVYWNAIAVADFSSSSNPFNNSGTAGNGIELVFGDNVERIPAYLNGYTSSRSKIISVTIGNSVTSIGDYAFYYCPSLASITFGDSVTSIGNYAFLNCTSLASITIPDSITSIGNYAFYYCTSLASITIGNSVKNIGCGAFGGCTSLNSIYIPDSVTSIGSDPFINCINLVAIEVDEKNSNYSSVEGILFDKNKSILVRYPAAKTSISYEIPDTVTSIGGGAFSSCTSLNSIYIPDSVTSIGNSAFASCTSLKDVYYIGTYSDWMSIVIGYNNTPLISAMLHCHEHIYSDEWTVDVEPTCTQTGSKSHHCTVCGDKGDVTVVDALGHSYGDWIVDEEATCTTDGSRQKTCSRCDDIVTEAIASPGHNYSTEWTVDVEPTCTENGSKSHHCTVCGDKGDVTVVDALGHSYGDWIVDEEATCTTDGSRHKTCSRCGDIVTETIVATGHDYSTDWIIDSEATCVAEGSKSRHCSVCGDKTDVMTIPTGDHTFLVVSAESGHPHFTEYKCAHCPETKQENVYLPMCALCNFTYTNNDDGSTCRITGYIGESPSFVMPADILGRTVVNTTTGAFRNLTNITSVTIEDGITGIGSVAFMGCSSLSKIIIPASVSSIGSKAFFNCASDFTIYCYRGSTAMTYAINNSHNYFIMDVGGVEGTTVDYDKELIFTDQKCANSIDSFLYIPETSATNTLASLVCGNKTFIGTGSVVTVYENGNLSSEYTVVVDGDTNGDSACDALDAARVALASKGQKSLDGAYKMAADGNGDGVVDIADYQAIVNNIVA